MSDLISRQAAIDEANAWLLDCFKVQKQDRSCELIRRLEDLPFEPIDVAPVVHAHWKIIYESSAGVTDARCSNCGFESFGFENDVHTDKNCNYCPCCGAKMDEEQ